MATKNNVRIGVQLDVEQSGVKKLQQALQSITNKVRDISEGGAGNLTEELTAASEAAKKLESILSSSWNEKLQQFNLTDVKKGIDDTFGSTQKLGMTLVKAGTEGQAAFSAFQTAVARTNIELVESNKLLDEMAESMSNTIKWGITSSIFNTLTGAVQKAYHYSNDLNESLNNIRIVTGASTEEMEKFAKTANSAAKALGSSTLGYTDASLIFYQQGLSDEDVQARTEATLKAANVTGQAASEVSEQLTAVWNGYKVEASEAQLYVDKLAAVAARTGADLEELSTGMGKVASAANSMGVDIDQLNAQLSTVITVTRQAPESVGTAFKTIYARLGDLDISGVTEDGVELGEVASQLAAAGINVLDATGGLRDIGTVIEEVAGKWNTWNSAQKQAVAIAMAGTRQYNNLLSLFENWDMYTAALETSTKAVGTLNKQNDIYLEGTKAKLQELKTEAERTYDVLFDDTVTQGLTEGLKGVLTLFNDFIEGIGGGTNALINLGSTAAFVFSKQIGRGIVSIKEKIDTRKRNKEGLAFKELMLAYDPFQYEIDKRQERLTTLKKEDAKIHAPQDRLEDKISKLNSKIENQDEVDKIISNNGTLTNKIGRLTTKKIELENKPQTEKEIKINEEIAKVTKEITLFEEQQTEAANKKNAAIENEYKNMSRILAVRKGLTDEQYKELTANEPKITALEQEIEVLEKSLEIEVKGTVAKGQDVQQLKEILDIEQTNYEVTKARQGAIDEITLKGQISVANAEDEVLVAKQIEELTKSGYLDEQQKIALQNIGNSLKDKEKLTEEETKTILEAQKTVLAEQKKEIDNIAQATEARQADEKGTLDNLKKQKNALENNRENTLKQGDAVIKATKATQLVTGSISGLTSIIGAITAATKETATASDKLNAGWQGTTGAASAIANMIAPGSGIIVTGVMELGKGLLEVTGLWDDWVDSIKTTEEKLADINQQLAETKQKTAEIEQTNLSVVAGINADKKAEKELREIENRFIYLQGLAEKGLLTDDLRNQYETYLDKIIEYNDDVLISYDAQGNRIAANTSLIQDAIKEQRKLNEEALKTTFSSDNFDTWKENQNTNQKELRTKKENEDKEALEDAMEKFQKLTGITNLQMINDDRIAGTSKLDATVSLLNMSEADLKSMLDNLSQKYDEGDSQTQATSASLVGEYRNNPQLIEKIIDIQNQYREAIDLTKLINNFTPDWDGLIQYLINNPTLSNTVKKAEEVGIENVDQFYNAYLKGLKKPPKNKDGTINYDIVTKEARNALANLILAFENVDGFKTAFDSLNNINKSDYDSSTAYHKALETYLNDLLKTIKSQKELDKYLPSIKAAFGDMFTSMTVSFDEAAGHAIIGKADSNSNFTTAGEKIARGFAETWTKAAGEGAKEGKIAIGDMILDIGDYDMTASLEKMFQDIFPEHLLERLDYDTVIDYIMTYAVKLEDGTTKLSKNITEILKEYKRTLEETTKISFDIDIESEIRRWIDFKAKAIDPVLKEIDPDAPENQMDAAIKKLYTYTGAQGKVVTGYQGHGDVTPEETSYNILTGTITKNLENYKTLIETGASQEDREKALENLMTSMEDAQALAEEVETSYETAFNNIGETIQKQFTVYDKISTSIQHTMRLNQLIYGEDSYDKLDNIYASNITNIENRVKLAQEQMNIYSEMISDEDLDEKTKAKAKEQYAEAAAIWQTEMEGAIEAVQAKYENDINKMFKEAFNFSLTELGPTWEDAYKDWGMISTDDEKYLDATNAAYEKQLIANKYNQAYEKASLSVQQKITEAMREQEIIYQQRDKLTKTDIERANLKYDLTMKQIALEEARENATTLRLRRDASGNMSYTFVADDDAISKAQAEVDVVNNAIYNLDKDAYKANLDEFYNMYTQYQEELKAAALLGEEERDNAIAKIQARYGDRLKTLLGENSTLWTTLDVWEGENPFGPATEGIQAFMAALGDGTSENNLEATMLRLTGDGEGSIQKAAEAMKSSLSSIFGTPTGGTDIFTYIANQNTAAANAISAVSKTNSEIIEEIDDSWTKAKNYFTEFTNIWEKFVAEGGPFQTAADIIETSTANLVAGTYKKEYSGEAEDIGEDIAYLLNKMAVFFTNTDIFDNIASGDTGMYTGEWGPEGKLTVLHEKELVLNQTDTSNVLAAVSIIRDVASLVGNLQTSVNNRISAATPAAIPTTTTSSIVNNNPVDQHIQIEAHFPNATSASEIDTAFTDLFNIASQRAYENKI